MNAQTAAEKLAALTPADKGIVAAALDDVATLGDDEAVDRMEEALFEVFTVSDSGPVAYHLVHSFGRKI
jgi:hypothetical protein